MYCRDSDHLKEECGVFGVSNAKDASALTALGLHALQHRGQEGCGIVTFDGKKYYSEKRFGLVGDNFNKEKVLQKPMVTYNKKKSVQKFLVQNYLTIKIYIIPDKLFLFYGIFSLKIL